MCGRFTLTSSSKAIIEQFQPENRLSFAPRYNIAPGQNIVAISQIEDKTRLISEMRWGLIPSWTKEKDLSRAFINARGETVATKPAFRSAFKRRRCLIVADGFYEWSRSDGEMFGQSRVAELLQHNKKLSAARVLEELKAKVHAFADTKQADDLTAIIIKKISSTAR